MIVKVEAAPAPVAAAAGPGGAFASNGGFAGSRCVEELRNSTKNGGLVDSSVRDDRTRRRARAGKTYHRVVNAICGVGEDRSLACARAISEKKESGEAAEIRAAQNIDDGRGSDRRAACEINSRGRIDLEMLLHSGKIGNAWPANGHRPGRSGRDGIRARGRVEDDAIHGDLHGHRHTREIREAESRVVIAAIRHGVGHPVRGRVPVTAGWVEVPRRAAGVD